MDSSPYFPEVSHDFFFDMCLNGWDFESSEANEFYQGLPLRKMSGVLLDLPIADLCDSSSESTGLGVEETVTESPQAPAAAPVQYQVVSREFIGTLTLKQRQEKLHRYHEKKRRRNWSRRIKYDCRKKVADNRVRVKGRFVSKAKAEELGISSLL
jgi:hypothetical protein